MTDLAIIATLLAAVLVPAVCIYALLPMWPDDRAAAIALALSPVAWCVAVTIAARSTVAFGVCIVIGCAMPFVASRTRLRGFTTSRVVWLWLASAAFWMAQASLSLCQGWNQVMVWDWSFHHHLVTVASGLLRQGWLPVNPMRTLLLGTWAAPAFHFVGQPERAGSVYWVTQFAVAVVHSLACPAAYLWAERLGGGRAGQHAWALALCCAGLTYWSLVTWSMPFAAILLAVGAYCYAVAEESIGANCVGWRVIAGVVLAAAFQAHITAAACVLAILLCGTAVTRRVPWALVIVVAVSTVGWMVADYLRYPTEWMAMGRDVLENRRSAQHGVVGTALINLAGTFIAPHRRIAGSMIDWVYIFVTGVFICAFPAIGTVALFRACVRDRFAWVMLVAVVLGTTCVFAVHPSPGPLLQGALPVVLMLLAFAATGIDRLPRRFRTLLWVVTVVQYFAIRVYTAGLNAWPGSASLNSANWDVKKGAQIIYIADRYAAAQVVGVVAAVALGTLLLWAFVRTSTRPERSA